MATSARDKNRSSREPQSADVGGIQPNGDDVQAVERKDESLFGLWTEFWKQAASISKYQGQVWVHWHEWLPRFAIAPLNNFQEILRGWFSPTVNTTINTMRSSDRAVEMRIVKDIAGYGSQLGTLGDCLQVLLKRTEVNPGTLAEDDKEAVRRFNRLALQIQRAKDSAGLRSTPRIADAAKVPTQGSSARIALSEFR